jgi:hypothetical protein
MAVSGTFLGISPIRSGAHRMDLPSRRLVPLKLYKAADIPARAFQDKLRPVNLRLFLSVPGSCGAVNIR